MTTKRKPKPKATKRAAAPARSSITGTTPFVSPKGSKYLIVHTTEIDEYEETRKKKKKT